MSLSARIVLRPSRHLVVVESLVAAGGLATAASALAARWPAWDWAVGIGAVAIAIACALWSSTSTTRRSGATIVVSDRAEVGLMATGGAPHAGHLDDGASWRLAEGTMVWPGLSVIALTCAGRARRTMPVLDRDLTRDERRALHRFLLWTLRGGSGRPADA